MHIVLCIHEAGNRHFSFFILEIVTGGVPRGWLQDRNLYANDLLRNLSQEKLLTKEGKQGRKELYQVGFQEMFQLRPDLGSTGAWVTPRSWSCLAAQWAFLHLSDHLLAMGCSGGHNCLATSSCQYNYLKLLQQPRNHLLKKVPKAEAGDRHISWGYSQSSSSTSSRGHPEDEILDLFILFGSWPIIMTGLCKAPISFHLFCFIPNSHSMCPNRYLL